MIQRDAFPGYHVLVPNDWDEPLALYWIKQAFEYVELRRDPDAHDGDSPVEREAVGQMRRAFEAQDMQALKQATRRYIREAPRDEG